MVLIMKMTITPVACVNNKNNQFTKLYYCKVYGPYRGASVKY